MQSAPFFNSKRERFYASLRCCVHCGLSSEPIDIYCSVCWGMFEPFLMKGDGRVLGAQPFPTYALFWWAPGETMMNHLISALKGGRAKAAFRRLAFEFALKRKKECRQTHDTLFIPAPSRRANQVDHAYEWGEALRPYWRASVLSILCKDVPQAQKTVKRPQRNRLRLYVKEKGFKRDHVQQKIVFVDDVLTTGATARAAFEALGRPPQFEVWVIAYRMCLAKNKGL